MKQVIIRIRGVLPILLVFFLLVSCKSRNGGDVTARLENHLIKTTRNTLALSDNIDVFAKSTKTDDPNRIRIDVYLSALGETSAPIPFEALGDGKQWNFKCLASDDVIDKNNKAFLERINSIKRASSRGNTKWDGVWIGPSWTIELNSKTDEAIVNGESSYWQDGGKFAVIAASGKSVLYMREDGRLFTGDNKGNISVDFGFSLKKQDPSFSSGYPNSSYNSEDTPQTETTYEDSEGEEAISKNYSSDLDELEEDFLKKKFESDYYSTEPPETPLFTPEFSQLMDKVETVYWKKFEDSSVGYFDYDVFMQGQDLIRFSHIEAKVVDDKGKVTIKREDGHTIIYSYVKRDGNWYIDDIRNTSFDKSEREGMDAFLSENQ